LERSEIFGDPAVFAIKYSECPVAYTGESADKYAICHLIINNLLIGNPTESCYIPTWFGQLSRFYEHIRSRQDQLYPEAFTGRSAREIFELVIKSNQLDDEFDPLFAHLPQLENEIWQHHFFSLDETVDAFVICYYIKASTIHFIVEKWWPEVAYEDRQFKYLSVPLEQFFDVVRNAMHFLKSRYPYLKVYGH
jgi:hypothetical protein